MYRSRRARRGVGRNSGKGQARDAMRFMPYSAKTGRVELDEGSSKGPPLKTPAGTKKIQNAPGSRAAYPTHIVNPPMLLEGKEHSSVSGCGRVFWMQG